MVFFSWRQKRHSTFIKIEYCSCGEKLWVSGWTKFIFKKNPLRKIKGSTTLDSVEWVYVRIWGYDVKINNRTRLFAPEIKMKPALRLFLRGFLFFYHFKIFLYFFLNEWEKGVCRRGIRGMLIDALLLVELWFLVLRIPSWLKLVTLKIELSLSQIILPQPNSI